MTDPVEVTAPSDPLDPKLEDAIEVLWVDRHQQRSAGMADLASTVARQPAEMGERVLQAQDDNLRRHLDKLRSAIRSALAEAREEGRKAGMDERAKLTQEQCAKLWLFDWLYDQLLSAIDVRLTIGDDGIEVATRADAGGIDFERLAVGGDLLEALKLAEANTHIRSYEADTSVPPGEPR